MNPPADFNGDQTRKAELSRGGASSTVFPAFSAILSLMWPIVVFTLLLTSSGTIYTYLNDTSSVLAAGVIGAIWVSFGAILGILIGAFQFLTQEPGERSPQFWYLLMGFALAGTLGLGISWAVIFDPEQTGSLYYEVIPLAIISFSLTITVTLRRTLPALNLYGPWDHFDIEGIIVRVSLLSIGTVAAGLLFALVALPLFLDGYSVGIVIGSPTYLVFLGGSCSAFVLSLLLDPIPSVFIRWRQPAPLSQLADFPPGIVREDLSYSPEGDLDKRLFDYLHQHPTDFLRVLRWVLQNWMQHWAIMQLLGRIGNDDFIWLFEKLLSDSEWNDDFSHQSPDPYVHLQSWLGILAAETNRSWGVSPFARVLLPVARLSPPSIPAPRLRLFAALVNFPSNYGEEAGELEELNRIWANAFKTSWQRLDNISKLDGRNGFLSFNLSSSVSNAEGLPESRTNLLEALNQAETVALKVKEALGMTSMAARQSTLAIVTQQLDDLRSRSVGPVPIIEYAILQGALDKWQGMLVDISAAEASTESVQIENPYIAGDPVTGNRFFDREGILGLLNDRIRTGQSLMLIGHRRSGKTSIMFNFVATNSDICLPVYVTMERLNISKDAPELLFRIAQNIHREAHTSGEEITDLMSRTEFFEDIAEGLDSILGEISKMISPKRIVLFVDEYEMLEKGLAEGKYSREELEYLFSRRGNEISFVVAGRAGPKQLQDMFPNSLFGRLTPEWTDMLGRSEASNLITNPVPDFQVNYDPDVVDRIIQETAGQPYLIQLICQTLVDNLKDIMNQNPSRGSKVIMADLEQVLSPDHFNKGSFYYGQVWSEVGKVGQQLLGELAKAKGAVSGKYMESAVNGSENIFQVLKELTDEKIVDYDPDTDSYNFTIPLMRRWVELSGLGRNMT